MNTTSQVNTVVEDLLAPVEQVLQDCAAEGTRVAEASRQLRQATEALEDAASDDWRLCAQTLAGLLEIIDCFAEGPETLASETTAAMVEFVRAALPDLRLALTGAPEHGSRPPLELTEQARSRWGEYLTLLDSDAFHESDALEEELLESGDRPAAFASGAESPVEQVQLILSTMKGPSASRGATHAAGPRPPATGSEFRSAESSASPSRDKTPGPPKVPATPQRISISETLLEAYLEDADQCLSSMERSVIAIENQGDQDASVKQLCRDLHTLKGASASIGLSQLATYLHEIEEWLQADDLTFAAGELQPILDCVDFVRLQIETLQHPEAAPSPVKPAAAQRPVEAHASRKPLLPVSTACDRSTEPGEETIRVRSSQLDRMMNLLVDLVIWRRQRDRHVVDLGRGGEELSRCVLRLERYAKEYPLHRAHAAGPLAQGQSPINNGRRETSSYLGELVSDLREIAASFRECRQSLADENRAVSHFIQQFRQQLTQIRRVPLAGLFQRLQRVVRDAARLEGKQVRLECTGQNTGLERSLQERLYEPLLHLVRNAVCHGIEPPEHRQRVGKDPVGTISLEASGSSQMLLLEIRDDGGGLDYDAIRRRGIERGLLRPDEPVSPNELSRLIFHPGFTTRTEASEMAGRGVGMDVVLTTLNRCHCQIDVQSEPGVGTSFRLAIPLPSVIEHFLVFRCGGRLFGLPMQFVMSTSQEETYAGSGRVGTGRQRFDLREILQLQGCGGSELSRSLVLGANLSSGASSAPHEGSRLTPARHTLEQRREFLVEEILGPEEVVVRPLPPLLRRHPVLIGVTLSGAGEVMLLLDGPRLLRAAARAESAVSLVEPSIGSAPPGASTTSRGRILIADDSLSARRRLVEKLAPHGFEVTEASDGLEALNFMHSESFDAVFSDLEMPGLDGFELLTEFKNHSRTQAKPVIIVTSRNEPDTRARADQLGADGFLAKPVTDSDIETLLQQPVFHRNALGAKD